MLSAQPRGGDEKRAWCGYLLVKRAHGRVKQLDPHTHRFTPGGGVQVVQVPLIIKRGQPKDSVDRAGSQPVLEPIGQLLVARGIVDGEDFHPSCLQSLCQRLSYSVVVRHE